MFDFAKLADVAKVAEQIPVAIQEGLKQVVERQDATNKLLTEVRDELRSYNKMLNTIYGDGDTER